MIARFFLNNSDMPEIQTVLTIKDRINLALERSGKSQRDLARALNKSSAAVSEMLSKPGEIDSITYVEATSKITGFRFEWIRTGVGYETEQEEYSREAFNNSDKPRKAIKPIETQQSEAVFLSGQNIRPITVTVDKSGKELISYVPVRAQAGYKRGFGDPHYIEKLPAYSLPINVAGTHRMFQVDGNSMRQLGGGGLNDGDIVIASYVEDIFSLKDGRVYVVISTDGVIIKRCINRLLTDDKVLVANSDNKSGEYPPIILHPNEILEVWELKAYISKQLSLATDLWDIINDLQVKVALVDDELKQMKQNRLQP